MGINKKQLSLENPRSKENLDWERKAFGEDARKGEGACRKKSVIFRIIMQLSEIIEDIGSGL